MNTTRRALGLALAVGAVFGSLAVPAIATAPALTAVPSGFVGVVVDGPMYPDTAAGVDLQQQFALMEKAGVESVRVVFNWAYAQPYASWSEVPAADLGEYTDVDGIPTDFSQTDEIVGLAARYGLTVLPTVIYAPSWDIVDAESTPFSFGRPAHDGPYAGYLTALVDRYGPKGSFWAGYSQKVPIHEWQIWNEPNIATYWPTQPFAKTYVPLLKAAAAAIRRADPSARIVLAGMPNYSWKALETIYRIPGARSAFDIVAVHPYTAKPAGVITILRYVRAVMDRNGDAHKPMIADEISWPSSVGEPVDNIGFDIGTTEKGQAANIASVVPALASDRKSLNLASFYYYTWASQPGASGLLFDYAGLLSFADGVFTEKPAFSAFEKAALAIEHCRRKGQLAPQCAQAS